ncbi:MAG: hypothetical protein SLAVMIC_00631 [uncultured marine phage]|uniref:Uncharacterized protein n=1 Tax=uncultured marine phage TaxID=707152 RepID=A0A8D9FSB1_9VIRU|nr:MAG: hypothetical protein SLAVMIC_00631 [uncultured marine phage]
MYERNDKSLTYKNYIVDKYKWKHLEKDAMKSYTVDWEVYDLLMKETKEERESKKKIEFREKRLSQILDK